MTPEKLNFVYKVQLVLTAIVTLTLFFIAPHQWAPFLGGSALITLNFFLLTSMWKRIFDKKPVATTLGLIVIKYAALGVLLFVFVKKWSFDLIPFFVGVTSIVGSFLILAIHTMMVEKNK